MSLLEFDQRAFEGTDGASFNGATVRLVGFVARRRATGFLVARYSIACCAADALAATALVVGWDGPVPDRDTWVEVEGTFEPGGEVEPAARRGVRDPDPEPDDPLRVTAHGPVIRFTGGFGTASGRNEPK